MASCRDCFYSRSIGSDIGVACHRYPPSITKVTYDETARNDTITAHFPLVNAVSWCGEYKRGMPKKH